MHSTSIHTYEQLCYVTSRISLDIFQPSSDVVERVFLCDVIRDNDAIGTSIVTLGDCTEPLLSCCVPDL